MITTITFPKKAIWCVVLLVLLTQSIIAQVTPYKLSTKWFFGYYAGMDFTGGVPVFMNGNTTRSNEAVTTIVDTLNNVIAFGPGTDGTNCGIFRPGNNSVNPVGGTSATQGAIAVPDPADPYNSYYYFSADDQTGGICPGGSGGIWWYKLPKTGTFTPVLNTNYGLLAVATNVSEGITSSVDTAGGYWIIAHGQGDTNFYVWHVTSSGVSAADIQPTAVPSDAVNKIYSLSGPNGTGGALKVTKCQDKIGFTAYNAFTSSIYLQVFAWNHKTGKIINPTVPIYAKPGTSATSSAGDGLEFSPNGNYAYTTDLVGQVLYNVDISVATGVWTLISSASSNSWPRISTAQLGPDDKIYVGNGAFNPASSVNIGVISSPNSNAALCSYSSTGFVMPATSTPTGLTPSTFEGVANIAWLSPRIPLIHVKTGSTCTESILSFEYKDYYGATISVTSIEWDYKNTGTYVAGTNPQTYDYGSAGSYTTWVRFKDQTCLEYRYAKTIVTPSCPAPLNWLTTSAKILEGNSVQISWTTTDERNVDYFIVQKSNDGINFTALSSTKANGKAFNQYVAYDLDFNSTSGYYKIIEVDTDGKKYESIILRVKGESQVKIYPNPSNNFFILEITGADKSSYSITDVTSRVIETGEIVGDYYNAKIGECLAKGTYILSIYDNVNNYHKKIIKE